MTDRVREAQALRVLQALEDAGCSFETGLRIDREGVRDGWWVRLAGAGCEAPHAFHGSDLLDALAQAATWVLHR